MLDGVVNTLVAFPGLISNLFCFTAPLNSLLSGSERRADVTATGCKLVRLFAVRMVQKRRAGPLLRTGRAGRSSRSGRGPPGRG